MTYIQKLWTSKSMIQPKAGIIYMFFQFFICFLKVLLRSNSCLLLNYRQRP